MGSRTLSAPPKILDPGSCPTSRHDEASISVQKQSSTQTGKKDYGSICLPTSVNKEVSD